MRATTVAHILPPCFPRQGPVALEMEPASAQAGLQGQSSGLPGLPPEGPGPWAHTVATHSHQRRVRLTPIRQELQASNQPLPSGHWLAPLCPRGVPEHVPHWAGPRPFSPCLTGYSPDLGRTLGDRGSWLQSTQEASPPPCADTGPLGVHCPEAWGHAQSAPPAPDSGSDAPCTPPASSAFLVFLLLYLVCPLPAPCPIALTISTLFVSSDRCCTHLCCPAVSPPPGLPEPLWSVLVGSCPTVHSPTVRPPRAPPSASFTWLPRPLPPSPPPRPPWSHSV